MKSRDDLAVVAKTYDFCLWFLPVIAKFPRSHRFTLGDRIEEELLNLLLGLVEAKYRHEKQDLLSRCNLRIEKLRKLSRAYGGGLLDLDRVTRSVQAWVAHASFGNTRRLRHDLLGRVVFPRREAVQAAVRGGNWNNGSLNCRSANRNGNEPTNPNDNIGFRLVAAPRTTPAKQQSANARVLRYYGPQERAVAESRPPSWPASASTGGAKSLGARTVW